MKKIWILLLLVMMLVVWGCGDESNDPTVRISSLTAEPSEIEPGGSSIITAKVVKAGTDTSNAWGVDVTFKLMTANGGSLSASIQETDGNGEARVVYTAGNNYKQDLIQATLENDNSASLIIKKTGSLSGPVISSMEANPTSVKVGQSSIVTITVTDNDNPVEGEYVDIKINPNNSGASLIISNHYTDAQGQVVATYVAGSLSSSVFTDVVHARVASSGSGDSVIITVNP